MIVLALFPPLWRAVMDPKVRAYYAGEEYQAHRQPARLSVPPWETAPSGAVFVYGESD